MKLTVWIMGISLACPLAVRAAGELPVAAAASATPAANTAATAAAAVAVPSVAAPAGGGTLAAPPAPVTVAEADRPSARLRDVLRHWLSGSEVPPEPYRLSMEERRRLREQLRAAPGPAAPAR